MLVQELMIKKENIITIAPETSLKEALIVMKKNSVKSLVVNKRHENDAYGIITYKNILNSVIANEGDIDLLHVYDIYSKPAFQISKELDVKYASQIMLLHNVKRLLVIDHNELKGIITTTDILKVLIENIYDIS